MKRSLTKQTGVKKGAVPPPIFRRPRNPLKGFSLVEVTIALGLVSYALLALLGLFVVGLSSSKESSLETALSQIAGHASQTYNGTNQILKYDYNGKPETTGGTNFQSYFSVAVTGTPAGLTNTANNLHLLKISISSANNPSVTNVIQTTKLIQ